MAFLCVSQQREFKNTIDFVLKKSMSKAFCKTIEGKTFFLRPTIFYRVFGRFSA
jgi:hypothetical protein